MEDSEFIEAGRIVNTHGVRGEVKIEPWGDGPEALAALPRLFVGGAELRVLRARVQKGAVIAELAGLTDMAAAEAAVGETVYAARADIALPEGRYFVSDLLGMDAADDATGEKLGVVSDIIDLPAGAVCEIRGERTILVPMRPEFLMSVDTAARVVRFRLIEGM